MKEDVLGPEDCLTEKALSSAVERQLTAPHEYDEVTLFFFYDEKLSDPKWAEDLKYKTSLPAEIQTRSAGALLFVFEAKRWFAFSYGTGHFALDKSRVVMDFGIRCAINMIKDDKVKSKEGVEVSTTQREATQSPTITSFTALSDSSTTEIVKRISGRIGLNESLSGATSLKFRSKKPITELSEDLAATLIAKDSEEYKNSEFAALDKLLPIKDKSYIKALNQKMVEVFTENSGEVELVIPAITTQDRDISYIKLQRTGIKPSPELIGLTIANYLKELPPTEEISLEILKKHRVAGFAEDGGLIHHDSIFNCIVGSLDTNITGETAKYVLNEGEWFQVQKNFKEDVDDTFARAREITLDNSFEPLRVISAKARKKKTDGYETELAYNTRVAGKCGYTLLDQKLVPVSGEGGRGLEFCDLLDHQGQRLIHVKIGGRQSSVMSHFFNQGTLPLSFFYSSTEFRSAVIEKVESENPDAKDFVDSLNPMQTNVHFVILDHKRSDGTFNIPFFSRITFYEKTKSTPANLKVWFVEPAGKV